jgi:hypothetical protein
LDAVGSFWFFIYLPCGRSAENFQPFSFQFLWDGSDNYSLLPPTLNVLYKLSKLDESYLQQAIEVK